ncbi:MAG: gliding motility-associated C-terminal domain-containing protein [Prevotellaceae bacterium]|nr:gliding motility-associated C-terminal domain-containing protein [Prevotellaceae bacterium]
MNGNKVYNRPDGFTDQPAATTVYTLRFTTNGTLFEYSLTVTVYEPPDLVIPNDVAICSGESVPLNATVTNATSYTKILWDYGGFNYNNGYLLSPESTGAHTVTATATNTEAHPTLACPTVSKDLHITVNFKPQVARGEPGTATHCSQDIINLNDCIDFFVYDTHANNEKKRADNTTGTIMWYTTDFTPVSDPEHVLLTSLNDTVFHAGLSGINVYYSNTCAPSFQQTAAPLDLLVPIPITSNHFSLDYGYDEGCRGDSVYARFRLLDNYAQPSPCATIDDIDILSAHSAKREVKTSSTEWMLVFAPFTGLDDTIKVRAKGNLPGLEKDFKLFLREPEPPSINSGTVCKNTAATFTVIADRCDTIYNVGCPSLSTMTVDFKSDRLWRLRVPELPNTTSFQCKVTYFDKLKNDTVKDFPINHTLPIWEDPPELSVSLMYDNSFVPFDNTTQNLCLGDSLLLTFYTPHDCDTITDVTWLQNPGTLSYQDKHQRSFIIKPSQEIDFTYRARVYYRQPKGTIPLSKEISYTVKVKRRPQLFINPPDTIKYCYPDDVPLNLNLPDPTDPIINYTFVKSGPDSVNFLVPKAGGSVDSLSSFSPATTGNYVVEANYRYLCSEMDTTLARGEVRIIVNRKDEDPASFIVTPPEKGFCILAGITIESSDREGSSLAWEYNGTPITFPYPGEAVGEGAHTFTTLISNACYPQSSPKRHDVKVRVVPVPKIEVMPDTTVCNGDSVALKVVPGSFVGDTLIWTFTSGTTTKDTVVIFNTTTFRGSAGNICGNVSDEVTITRMPFAEVKLMPDTSVCKYDRILLRVVQMEGDTVKWRSSNFDFIGTGKSVTIWISGNETYTAIVSNRCSSDSAGLNVTALPLPSVKVVTTDTSICYGASLDLNTCVFQSWIGSLKWTPDHSTNMTEPGTYVATASTPKCGSDSDTMYVNVYPPLILLPDDSRLPNYRPYYNEEDFYEVRFQTLQSKPPLSYTINGTLPPGLTVTNGNISGKPKLGVYDYNTHHLEVSVVDGHQCRISKEYILLPEWKAPNVLLPMGDADNAMFLRDYNIEVYNRNGLLLHKGMGWNGTWNNAFVPAGTYFYKVNVLIDNSPEKRMSYVVVMY